MNNTPYHPEDPDPFADLTGEDEGSQRHLRAAVLQPTMTYAQAYAVLHEISEKLRRAGPEDIETLIDDYRRAMGAYRICANRLELIRQELEQEP